MTATTTRRDATATARRYVRRFSHISLFEVRLTRGSQWSRETPLHSDRCDMLNMRTEATRAAHRYWRALAVSNARP